jgi:hypothetical protein
MVNHMECSVKKRDYAYQIAQNLTGKETCDKVFPKYEENKNKALDLIALYKDNVEGGKLKKDIFWG